MRIAVRMRARRGVLVACLLVSACAAAFAQPKVEVVPQQPAPMPTVAAIGEATAMVHPDTAVLTFAVEVRDPNTTQAVGVNERMTRKVVGKLEKAGVGAPDVEVGIYRMRYVVNDFVPALGTNQPVEFRVEQHGTYKVTSDIIVTVHDLSKVADLINTALAAGVDRIDRVRYESSRAHEIEAGLVGNAVKDARKKAVVLARETGLTVGEPLHVIELPDASSAVRVLDGNTVSGQRVPPMLQVRLRVRVVYAAAKAGN